jgi:hypothetical protein
MWAGTIEYCREGAGGTYAIRSTDNERYRENLWEVYREGERGVRGREGKRERERERRKRERGGRGREKDTRTHTHTYTPSHLFSSQPPVSSAILLAISPSIC